MEHAAPQTSAWFEAFKGLANVMANPWLSFSLATFGLLLMLKFRRYVFNWWIGSLVLAVEAAVVLVGMRDRNFALIVGKPDNVPITMMLFISTFVLWLSMVQAVNNERRTEQKLPSDERETSQQKTWVCPDLLYIEFIGLILRMVALLVSPIRLRSRLVPP